MLPGLLTKKRVNTPASVNPGQDPRIVQQAEKPQHLSLVYHFSIVPIAFGVWPGPTGYQPVLMPAR